MEETVKIDKETKLIQEMLAIDYEDFYQIEIILKKYNFNMTFNA